ncbi:hypothetical protein DSO57_1018868 [Entomophthora muscae]|uniref:Uncharacterized protein n=1 Tax=Entomophthora muscae TaxID=34485 RepID=A0ACC2RIQ3_9FUNG|nr:hypothetical protein DSO57_1018868 [Entomophthora muscae]
MLTSKGVAAVPRASLVILAGTVTAFDLPLEAIIVIMGVDALMDMGRTAVNLTGNCVAAIVVAVWEGEFDYDVAFGRKPFLGDVSSQGSQEKVTSGGPVSETDIV